MKRKLIIVGNSATGKTEVVKLLGSKDSMKQLITHTTRKKRSGESASAYKWVTKGSLLPNGIFLHTIFRGEHYYTTLEDFEEADVAIVTYDAIPYIRDRFPNSVIVKLQLTDMSIKRERLLSGKRDMTEESLFNYMNEKDSPNELFDKVIKVDTITLEELREELKLLLDT